VWVWERLSSIAHGQDKGRVASAPGDAESGVDFWSEALGLSPQQAAKILAMQMGLVSCNTTIG